jgi:hypothetical protein
MANEGDKAPLQRGREPLNHAGREQKQGDEQGLQTGRSDRSEQLRQRPRDNGKADSKPRSKGEGDYGVAAGRRYDDQTTRQVYEEPERSKDR